MKFLRLQSLVIVITLLTAGTAAAQAWSFVDVTKSVGLVYEHGHSEDMTSEVLSCAGGVAAGDYDNDGWVDLYVVGGSDGPNLMFRNRGDGTFEEVGRFAGVALFAGNGSGPLFADLDGDGWLDLFVGGVGGAPLFFLRNMRDGSFENATLDSRITYTGNTYSICAGDYDRDGDLDLLMSHWNAAVGPGHLWRNDGSGHFESMDVAAGLDYFGEHLADFSFTPNFADINNDGWPDILFAGDFGTSQVYVNRQDGTFENVTTSVINDENGMGATVGDYDNDGDLDWFVSSVWDTATVGDNWGISGNRLYRNKGDGVFEDATDEAGVRIGYWGWGSAFADLNNDGHLDIFHVNGWRGQRVDGVNFSEDPARLFVNDGAGRFDERAAELNANVTGLGRGVVCFDYDRDGDLDLFIANNSGPPNLLRNDGGNALNYITVKLRGPQGNMEGIGARVYVTASGFTQKREIRAGSNYTSQNPAEAHFGIGAATQAAELRVEWPDGETTVMKDVAANQLVTVEALSFEPPRARASPPRITIDAHPNPFTGEARIGVRIERGIEGELEIYDVVGRRVRTLRVTGAGQTPVMVRWRGLDKDGRRVPSGVYFIRLTVAGEFVTRRITLVR